MNRAHPIGSTASASRSLRQWAVAAPADTISGRQGQPERRRPAEQARYVPAPGWSAGESFPPTAKQGPPPAGVGGAGKAVAVKRMVGFSSRVTESACRSRHLIACDPSPGAARVGPPRPARPVQLVEWPHRHSVVCTGNPHVQHPQFAVFGHPISHSLSPQIHQAFAQQFGIALDYRAIDATRGRVRAQPCSASLPRAVAARNVTLPHKAAAFALADEAQPGGHACRHGQRADPPGRRPAGGAQHRRRRHGARHHRAARRRPARSRLPCCWAPAAPPAASPGTCLTPGVDTLTIVNRSPASADALADAIGEPARARTRATGRTWPASAAST